MFTGIIKDVGSVKEARREGGGVRLTIASGFADELTVDESVSVNGACQTVVNQNGKSFQVVAIEETLRKTTLGELAEGRPVNLERAMKAGARFDGHFVQGHVDATGEIIAVEKEETNWLYTISFPSDHASYLIPVGSITVDGISLTVARLEDDAFVVAIIPHTLDNTLVRTGWKPGAKVNLEYDMIGKYVARQLKHHTSR